MLHTLQNAHWQAGILPKTGGSIAFGRMRYSGAWVDIMRPTDESDYDNASNTSSFVMLPWANRIRDGLLRYEGQSWQLKTASGEHARHGDVRKRAWQVVDSSETHITLRIQSADFEDFNFPFACSAEVTYRLEDSVFVWEIALTNEDNVVFPAGFGFHPYFVRMAEPMPMLQVPCDKIFELTDALPDDAPVPVPAEMNFQMLRAVPDDLALDDLYANRDTSKPVRIVYPAWQTELQMHVDDLFKHVILFKAPDGSLAVEPQTNANDGFTLHDKGLYSDGIFTIEPQKTVRGAIRWELLPYSE